MAEEQSKTIGEQLEDGVQVLVQAIEKRRGRAGMTSLAEAVQVAEVSTAISAKRQADALEKIAHNLGDLVMMLHSRG